MSDDGSPDPRLAAALLAYDGSAPATGEVLAALSGARVFLALAAEAIDAAGEPVVGTAAAPRPAAGQRELGQRQESAARMSLLSLVAPSGARALPVFADGRQVQVWRSAARPVAVPGPLACRTAYEDGAAAVLLDPLGAAVPVGGPWLPELAAGRVPVVGTGLSTRRDGAVPCAPPAGQPPVAGPLLQALGAALSPEPVRAAHVLPGADGVPVLVVTPQEAMPAGAAAALAARVRSRLGAALPPAGLDLAVADPSATSAGMEVPLPRRRGARWRRDGRPGAGPL